MYLGALSAAATPHAAQSAISTTCGSLHGSTLATPCMGDLPSSCCQLSILLVLLLSASLVGWFWVLFSLENIQEPNKNHSRMGEDEAGR